MAGCLTLPQAAMSQTSCDPEPTNMTISYGAVVACAIDVVGDTDTFTFSGTSGESIRVVVSRSGNETGFLRFPCVELRSPTNQNVIGPRCGADFSGPANFETLLQASGTYSLVISEVGDDEAVSYTLSLDCLLSCAPPPGCEFSLSPSGQSFGAVGGVGSVSVLHTAGTGCPWSAASNAAFISIITGATGSGNATVTFSVAVNTGAARGGTLTIAGHTFTVTQAGTRSGPVSSFTISPSSISVSATVGQPTARRQAQIVSLGDTVNWRTNARMLNGNGWLRVLPAAGTTGPLQSSSLLIEIDYSALGAAGLFQGVIEVGDEVSGFKARMPVTVVLSSQQSRIGLSESSIHLTIAGGGVAPPPQTLRILNRGGGTLNWSTGNIEFHPAAANNWLNLSASSGTAGGTFAQSSPLVFSLNDSNARSLASGVYQALVPIISAGASNSPQFVVVTLQRVPGATPATPNIRPGGLVFVAREGGPAPAPKTFTVANRGGGSLTAQFSLVNLNPFQNWVSTNVTSGTLTATSGPLTVQVTANPGVLTRGIYRNAIRATFSSGEPVEVDVTLIVTPPAVGALRLAAGPSPQLEGCTPTAMELVAESIATGASVPISFPRTLLVTLVDNCGELVDDATVVGSAQGEIIDMQPLGGGTYSGEWTPQQQGASAVTFEARHPALPTTNAEFPVSAAVAPEGIQLPLLLRDGIVEAAALTPSRPLAPGGSISISGARFTTQTAVATTIPLPEELAGVRVRIAGRDAPLYYVSPEQIYAQMLVELPAGASVPVSVNANGVFTSVQGQLLAPAMPGIYIGAESAAVLDTQGRLVTPQNPARAGDTLQVYAAGLGATNPPVASGEASPESSTVTNPVSVTVGGVPAAVVFQGLAPGFVGLYRVDLIVPSGVTAGGEVPIVITQNGIPSNPELPATIPVVE